MIKLENLKRDIVLAPYTTYKIGGKADYFFTARSSSELKLAILEATKSGVPFFLLGTGANILIGDKGFRGLVIHNRAEKVSLKSQNLIAESGALISDLIKLSLEKGLSGLEHFAGIPSTVGGAIRQNLHFLAPDRKSTYYIESVVKKSLVLESGLERRVGKDYFKFGYDDSVLHHNQDVFVLEVTFSLEKRDPKLIEEQIKANLAWREEKQPQLRDFPSCGSVFKKIEGVGAGRLIDQCGLKGLEIGGARVSEKHANYLVNTGGATASDVRELIKVVQDKVLEETGYKLEPEVGFVGEF